jgi:cytochrome c551/c552
MTTYDSIASTFTDNDDSAARLAMLDAVAEAEADTVIDPMACPICHYKADYLVIIDDQGRVQCDRCGALYEIPMPAELAVFDDDGDYYQERSDVLADIQRA